MIPKTNKTKTNNNNHQHQHHHHQTEKLVKPNQSNKKTNKKGTTHNSNNNNKNHHLHHNTTEFIDEGKVGCWQLCCLLCCPPCPDSVAEKVAFRPPKPATYSVTVSVDAGRKGKVHMQLLPSAHWYYSQKQTATLLNIFRTTTERGSRIVCLFIRSLRNAKYTLLFSHGNAADLGLMASCYYQLTQWINVNVFSYDYSGYGASTGKPTEKNIYADIVAAFKLLTRPPLNVPPNRVILYGQSIGSAPTIYLASKNPAVAGVVIQSGFTSGMRLMFDQSRPIKCCDSFSNVDRAVLIEAPVLIIHGTADDVIDIEHGLELYRACPHTVDACWIQNAGHNDIMAYPEYYHRMSRFLIELDKYEMKHLKI